MSLKYIPGSFFQSIPLPSNFVNVDKVSCNVRYVYTRILRYHLWMKKIRQTKLRYFSVGDPNVFCLLMSVIIMLISNAMKCQSNKIIRKYFVQNDLWKWREMCWWACGSEFSCELIYHARLKSSFLKE